MHKTWSVLLGVYQTTSVWKTDVRNGHSIKKDFSSKIMLILAKVLVTIWRVSQK